jgi:hypothetical protein
MRWYLGGSEDDVLGAAGCVQRRAGDARAGERDPSLRARSVHVLAAGQQTAAEARQIECGRPVAGAAAAIMARAESFTVEGAWPSAQLIVPSALALLLAVFDHLKKVIACT